MKNFTVFYFNSRNKITGMKIQAFDEYQALTNFSKRYKKQILNIKECI